VKREIVKGPDGERLFSPKAAAEVMGVCLDTALRMIKRGDLKASRVGLRRWRIRESDLPTSAVAFDLSGSNSGSHQTQPSSSQQVD
jgi:excisionase family DNA binding protein